MPKIRPQYHFRETKSGLDAWDVRRLIALSADLPVGKIDPAAIQELHSNHWYKEIHQVPSPASIVEHIHLINACELSYPVILDSKGRVMDGMHRICKALLEGVNAIDAVQFEEDPPPDFKNCSSLDLPYDD